jgi:hypothetical protein
MDNAAVQALLHLHLVAVAFVVKVAVVVVPLLFGFVLIMNFVVEANIGKCWMIDRRLRYRIVMAVLAQHLVGEVQNRELDWDKADKGHIQNLMTTQKT